MNSFYEKLNDRSKKRFALLVDPDKHDDDSLEVLIDLINQFHPMCCWWVAASCSTPSTSPSPP